ncbi:hypothetical protein P0Y35_18715 [Kiritimatiellaeota bacterium B1221]|nr:hypothetical protein [Kiritimatiellaeota bacterium B1221]
MAALLTLLLAWSGIALVRLRNAQSDFEKERENSHPSWSHVKEESDKFFASASLCKWRSLRPLLKNPIRSDVRLYFVYLPRINNSQPNAWASNESGYWEWKIHN